MREEQVAGAFCSWDWETVEDPVPGSGAPCLGPLALSVRPVDRLPIAI